MTSLPDLMLYFSINSQYQLTNHTSLPAPAEKDAPDAPYRLVVKLFYVDNRLCQIHASVFCQHDNEHKITLVNPGYGNQNDLEIFDGEPDFTGGESIVIDQKQKGALQAKMPGLSAWELSNIIHTLEERFPFGSAHPDSVTAQVAA
jgi:hypothetical protein